MLSVSPRAIGTVSTNAGVLRYTISMQGSIQKIPWWLASVVLLWNAGCATQPRPSLVARTGLVAATAPPQPTKDQETDDTRPEYWTSRLGNPADCPLAVKRLDQFFGDVLVRANRDWSSPEVRALIDRIVVPLTDAYVRHHDVLGADTRGRLLRLLAELRDPRTEPALRYALLAFAADPSVNAESLELKWAARGVGFLKLQGLGDPLLQAFMKFRVSAPGGFPVYKDLDRALVGMPQATWVSPLCRMLQAPIIPPRSGHDKRAIGAYQDELFWQTTAAQVLGLLKDGEAVEPLLKVMLDPLKEDIQATAILALVKIGKPAVAVTSTLLAGKNQSLREYSWLRVKLTEGKTGDPSDAPEIRMAALVLGTIGRSDAMTPMLEALAQAKNDVNRATIAREIAKLPPTKESKAAFRATFERIPLLTILPPSVNALQILAESAPRFYDPSMVPWLLERVARTRALFRGRDQGAA